MFEWVENYFSMILLYEVFIVVGECVILSDESRGVIFFVVGSNIF